MKLTPIRLWLWMRNPIRDVLYRALPDRAFLKAWTFITTVEFNWSMRALMRIKVSAL